jgi:hypothetical protein
MRLMKLLAVILLLAGCEGGKYEDMRNTRLDGYSTRCIDGTQYVLMSSDRGLAVTVHLGTDGKPRGCDPK